MVRDTLSDLVARIKNGYLAGADQVVVPWSRVSEETVKVLTNSGYTAGGTRAERTLVVKLKYEGRDPALANIVRVSKPGSRIYLGYRDIPRVLGGIGMHVVSTPQGVMSDKQAKKLKAGGEIICKVW